MTMQLTMAREEVAVCASCGLPRSWDEPCYERANPDCVPCRLRHDEEQEACDSCEELSFDTYEEHIWLSPFDDEETATGFRFCQPCLDQGGNDPDGQQFYCDGCSREIASDNGRMIHYHILNACEMVCLRCIEEDLKRGGIATLDDEDILTQLFAGKPFGMFFNVGELEAEGWEPDPLYHDYRLDAGNAIKLGARAHGWHNSGRLIIIGYERLSIMGDEGYVTLYTKEAS